MAPPPGPHNPKGIRENLGGLAANALVSGVVSAIVGGLIAFYVANWQSQDSAKQAAASVQIQQIAQLEEAAETLLIDSNSMSEYANKCPSKGVDSLTCVNKAPGYNDFMTNIDVLAADTHNVTDVRMKHYALAMLQTAQGMVFDVTAQARLDDRIKELINYNKLIDRCGQLVRGQL